MYQNVSTVEVVIFFLLTVMHVGQMYADPLYSLYSLTQHIWVDPQTTYLLSSSKPNLTHSSKNHPQKS